MTRRLALLAGVTVLVVAGTVAAPGAQKGKPQPSGPLPGVATFDCVYPDETRGMCATQPLIAELTTGGPNEMEIRDTTGDASAAMILGFNGQRPEDSPDRVDCSTAMGTCLWDWSQDPRSGDFILFALGTNVLDPTGSTELSNGLMSMNVGSTVYKVRLNMTIRVPETEHINHWRFNFNPSTPTTGGADLADIVRVETCKWVLSAGPDQRAALSILVKPAKGKQYVHHEGTYAMPFALTFEAPGCGG